MEGKFLEGAKFVLLDEMRNKIAVVKTDECGEAYLANLPFGHYFVRQIEAPKGFCICSEEIELVIDERCKNRVVEFVNPKCNGSIRIISMSE